MIFHLLYIFILIAASLLRAQDNAPLPPGISGKLGTPIDLFNGKD